MSKDTDKIEDKSLLPSLHKAGINSSFYSLIDRMEIHSEWKYPNRSWSINTYYNIAWEWRGKQEQLEERVIKLEKEMNDEINGWVL